MPDKPSDLVQGTLDMLILKTLALEPTHGYGISVRIEQMSKGVFRLNAGSLFLAIQRLERDGLIDGEGTKEARQRNTRMGQASGRNRQNFGDLVGSEPCLCSEILQPAFGRFSERTKSTESWMKN